MPSKMDSLVVASKAKAILKKYGCNTSSDALDGLNGWAYWLLEQASKRAKANKRKTVRSHDFILPMGKQSAAPAAKKPAKKAPARGKKPSRSEE